MRNDTEASIPLLYETEDRSTWIPNFKHAFYIYHLVNGKEAYI